MDFPPLPVRVLPVPSLTILHLLTSDRWTGAAQPVCSLVQGLRGRGHRVLLGIVAGKSLERHCREMGLDLVEGLNLSRRFSPIKHWVDKGALADLVRSEGVDLLHCHLSHDHWLAGIARELHRLTTPIVRTLHRVGDPRRQLGERLLWGRFTDAVVVLAESCRHERRFANLSPDRLHVIHGGVDIEQFHPRVPGIRVRESLGIPPQAPVAGMIAHFKAGRGWRTAVPAFAEVHRRNPGVHFLLAGGHSRLVKWIRAEMEAAGCLAQTHILTDRRHPWPEVLAAMDLSVWLAPGSEGSARAVLEVMATGRPVLAGALGVAPEVVGPVDESLLLPVGVTAAQLAGAVENLVRDPARRMALGESARARIVEHYALARQVMETEDLYGRLTGL